MTARSRMEVVPEGMAGNKAFGKTNDTGTFRARLLDQRACFLDRCFTLQENGCCLNGCYLNPGMDIAHFRFSWCARLNRHEGPIIGASRISRAMRYKHGQGHKCCAVPVTGVLPQRSTTPRTTL